jgi:acetolactate synthase-1/2/3 large subunit
MLMTGNELATAIQHGAKPLIVLSNNGRYGTIRQHQEKHYPGRVKATGLRNPDFVALARAFGAAAWRIDAPEQVMPVLKEALATDAARWWK